MNSIILNIWSNKTKIIPLNQKCEVFRMSFLQTAFYGLHTVRTSSCSGSYHTWMWSVSIFLFLDTFFHLWKQKLSTSLSKSLHSDWMSLYFLPPPGALMEAPFASEASFMSSANGFGASHLPPHIMGHSLWGFRSCDPIGDL